MASYQPQHQPATRQRLSTNSLETSWFVTEISPATHENIFSDTLSSPLSSTRRSLSAAPDQEWEEQALPTSMIRFPTHDGRGGFTLALTSQQSVQSLSTAHPQSQKLPSTKALSTHASTSSSILDDALPRHPHVSTDLSQRIHAWAHEQQIYARLRHKRRRLSNTDECIPRRSLEGWIWRFVSSLINMDDQLLQIVLGEKLYDHEENASSDEPSFWESFLQRTSAEKHLSSPFPSPHFQQIFRAQHDIPTPPSSTVQPRPTPQNPTPRAIPRRQQLPPPTSSSWSSFPTDPIQTAPFNPTPIHLNQTTSESSHAPWGIEDSDLHSQSTEIPDDYWDREFTIPLVWHIVKNYITTRLPRRQKDEVRSCKEESLWDDLDGTAFYWHESIDGASSLGLGFGGLGHWAEV